MQNRILGAGSFLLAAAVAWAPSVSAQVKPQPQHQIVPCSTPATHGGGAFLVIPGGAAEKILRATPAAAPAPKKVTHSAAHGKAQSAPKPQTRDCQPRAGHKR